MMKYKPCDLSSFPFFADEIHKTIHQFNLDENKLPENQNDAYDESGEPIFTDELCAIDLDKFERLCFEKWQIKKFRKLRSSTDMAFLVENEHGEECVILVEYRLNYKNPKNLEKTELIQKVNCSSKVIQRCFKKTIHNVQYFVFSEEEFSQMHRKINRIAQESNGLCQFKAVTIQMLFDDFFK